MSASGEADSMDQARGTLPADQILYPIPEAFERLSGRRPSPSTCMRWRQRGVKGVRLETTRLGGQRMCSLAAARRFNDAINEAVDGPPSAPLARMNRERNAAINRADRELAAALGD